MIANTFLLLAACGPTDTNGGPDTDPVDTYESTLSDLESETLAHGDTVFAANQVNAISGAESDYWSLCRDGWDQMNSCWDAMSGCGMMGGGNHDAWWSWMHDMWESMEDHHDTMEHCSDVADCHTREGDWQDHMAEMFEDMHGMESSWPEDCHW